VGVKAKGVIVNCGDVTGNMGADAFGVIVNLGECGKYMGSHAHGVTLNFGKTGLNSAIGDAALGVVLDFRKNVNWGEKISINKRLVIDGSLVPVIPNFREYCEDLGRRLETIRDADDAELPALLSQLPKAEDIKKDLTTLAEEAQ